MKIVVIGGTGLINADLFWRDATLKRFNEVL